MIYSEIAWAWGFIGGMVAGAEGLFIAGIANQNVALWVGGLGLLLAAIGLGYFTYWIHKRRGMTDLTTLTAKPKTYPVEELKK